MKQEFESSIAYLVVVVVDVDMGVERVSGVQYGPVNRTEVVDVIVDAIVQKMKRKKSPMHDAVERQPQSRKVHGIKHV